MGTRLSIRNAIRAKVSAWPDIQATLGGAVLAADSTLTITAAHLPYITDRALVEFMDGSGEVAQVIGLTAAAADTPPTNPVSVIRSVRGSSAAANHANGSAINIHPFWGWTDADLNRYIQYAVDRLGQSMVWTLKPYTNTWLAGNKEFGLPAGVFYPQGDIVKRVEFMDPTSNTYKDMLGWTHIGDRIILNSYIIANYNVRLWIQTKQAQFTDDVTQLDNAYAEEAMVSYCAGRILEELLANRSRFYDYSASLNDRATQPDELQRTAYFFLNQAEIAFDKISRPGLSGMAPIQRS